MAATPHFGTATVRLLQVDPTDHIIVHFEGDKPLESLVNCKVAHAAWLDRNDLGFQEMYSLLLTAINTQASISWNLNGCLNVIGTENYASKIYTIMLHKK